MLLEKTLSPDWYGVAVIRGIQQVNTSLVFCCRQHVKGGTASDSSITRFVHNMMQTKRKERKCIYSESCERSCNWMEGFEIPVDVMVLYPGVNEDIIKKQANSIYAKC